MCRGRSLVHCTARRLGLLREPGFRKGGGLSATWHFTRSSANLARRLRSVIAFRPPRGLHLHVSLRTACTKDMNKWEAFMSCFWWWSAESDTKCEHLVNLKPLLFYPKVSQQWSLEFAQLALNDYTKLCCGNIQYEAVYTSHY